MHTQTQQKTRPLPHDVALAHTPSLDSTPVPNNGLVYRLQPSESLTDYLSPHHNPYSSPTLPPRILHALRQLGKIQLHYRSGPLPTPSTANNRSKHYRNDLLWEIGRCGRREGKVARSAAHKRRD